MPLEIERKFLINKAIWEKLEKPQGYFMRQGYISTDPSKTIRVRLTDEKAFLTIKGQSVGAVRAEFEYEIPQSDAKQLLDNFAESELSKTRYKINFDAKTWEVDEFYGDNEGLIVAEIELDSEDESFEKPIWITDDVTDDKRYFNSNLTKNPYKNWK
jgi:CYTH domain-containing protein